ncbi:type VII secretion integral membrane protein EccD [Actinoalloteichus spitiensis]|uniref:type VII secretion integral membrane protein EccD n=1 Tax=Actinoalloteichus spitiensis TaxID=252394 RepID=UPI0004748F42|nr:type VII secretion integral membrane protein EccD [Actinoalloteichus spitiensis]
MDDASKDATSQLCRLRLVIGDNAVDLALPSDVPLVDLLPAILRQAGGDLADEAVEHEGFVLQRLGQPPFDEEYTPGELGLVDGETVHLRPRTDGLPAIDFDDLVAGVADQSRMRRDRWKPRATRNMLLGFAGATLLLGLLVLLVPGPVVPRVSVMGGIAAALLVSAAVVARSVRDTVTGAVLAVAGFGYAAGFGWLFPLVFSDSTTATISAVCASAAGAAALVLGLVGVADAALVFTGGLVLSVFTLATALLAGSDTLGVSGAAGIVLVVTLVAQNFVPSMSFRLGRLGLPTLPTAPEELNEDIEPTPFQSVIDGAVATDRYMTTLYLVFSLIEAALLTALVWNGSGWALITAAVVGLLLVLRSRHLDAGRHRWSLLAAGGYGLAAVVIAFAADQALVERLAWVFGGVMVLALALLAGSAKMPGYRPPPYWGRTVDILETLCAAAVAPLLLAMLDVYGIMRGLAG